MPADALAAVAGELPRVPVGFDTPLEEGQLVWMVGYPTFLSRLERRALIQRCRIVEPEVKPLVDPNRVTGSSLEVPSFVIDCMPYERGSPGSPVFDAETGVLLGLLWAEDLRGFGSVSAAQGWRAFAEARAGDPELGALGELVRRAAR